MWNFVCLFLIYFITVQSRLYVAPRNKAIVAGQRMEIECRTDSGTKVREWTLQGPSTMETLKIFINFDKESNRINPDFSFFGAVVDANGSGLIYLNSTRLTDAGVYTCKVQEGQKQPAPYSAQLVVLEKEPVCATNLTSGLNLKGRDKIWFQCSVNFSGNWAPNIEWRQHCGDSTEAEQLSNEEVETIITDNFSVTSTLILAMDSSRSSCNISCKIYFTTQNSNTINTTATNIPDYSYVWYAYENQIWTGFQLSTWELILKSEDSTTLLQRGETTVLTLLRDEPEGRNTSGIVSMGLVSIFSLVVGVAATVVVIYCIRLRKRKPESQIASPYEQVEAYTEPELDGYEMLPYAFSDGYDTIEEPNIEGYTEYKPTLQKHRHGPNVDYLEKTDDVTDIDLAGEISSSYLKIIEEEEEIPSAYLTIYSDEAHKKSDL